MPEPLPPKSDPSSPSAPSESSVSAAPSDPAAAAAPEPSGTAPRGAAPRAGLARLVPRGRGARRLAVGAAAVVVGGAAVVAVAAAEHHRDRHERAARFVWSEPGAPGGPRAAHPAGPGERRAAEGPGERRGAPGERQARRLDDGDRIGKAPAPLPSLPIGQAAEKAAAAVPGGRVESVRTVAQEGGGSAWRAVVVGPDGVRHAVTVSGTDGAVTGNTVLDTPRRAAGG
ncbi:hypothetical protein [Streptomyces sp. NPDC048606]|uniref:hypothetical protein n=1 Tax=Streptomyces sp. NPDC048606 TaxID=3154726 RepID=UPI00341E127A